MIEWARRHRWTVDIALAVMWSAICLITLPAWWLLDEQVPIWLTLTAGLGIGLVLRRGYPRWSIAITAVVLVVHVLTLHTATTLAIIGACAAAHTAHAQLGKRDRWVVTALIMVGTGWAALDYSRDFVDLGPVMRLPIVGFQWILIGFFALLGASVRHRRDELAQAIEHAELLERQQSQEIKLATLAERTHIAREMHDIVAHSLGVIVAQADGGRYAAEADPTAAKTALATISEVGRHSLTEMRQLLSVLRSDEFRDVLPTPGLADLNGLADDFRKAGLAVRLVNVGSPQPIPKTLDLTAYRVIQESLSNALKHAGPVAVKVELAWTTDHLAITVRNALPPRTGEDRPAGHGLVGMAERVEMHGGTFTAQPVDSIWQVRAELPLPHSETPKEPQ